MPIEIKELIIRATVDPSGAGKQGEAPASRKGKQPDGGEIVAQCVEQVLEILRQREER